MATSRSRRNTCPLKARVQHLLQRSHRNPTSLMIDTRRSCGYARSSDNSCSAAAILDAIGIRETETTSCSLPEYPALFIVCFIRYYRFPLRGSNELKDCRQFLL